MSNTMYLVTGAAGFLGGTICRQLVDRGEKVRAFVLPNDKAMKFVPKEAEIVEGDLCDMESLRRFFTVPEGTETIVLHIASIVTVSPEYNQKVMDVNVGGTKNIIELCLEHKECKKLVYCSSTGAIPELPKGQKIKEVDHFDADKGKDGSCYILGNKEVSFKKFSELLMVESGCKPIKAFLPLGVANFIAGVLEKQLYPKKIRLFCCIS